MRHQPIVSVAALVMAAGLAFAGPAAAREAGVAAAVNADSKTLPPQQDERTLIVGHNLVFDEKITTGEVGQAQLLMLDQSAVTVGRNSTLVIDKFVYDPEKKTGEMALSLSRGLMRFVGGRLSKNGSATIRTPVATMGIRGGIALFNVVDGATVDVTLLYGDSVEGTTNDGQAFSVRRHGYFTRVQTGQKPTPPAPAGSEAVALVMSQLEGRDSATAGAPEAPTEEGTIQQIGAPPEPPFVQVEADQFLKEVIEAEGDAEDRVAISNPEEEDLGEENLAGILDFEPIVDLEIGTSRRGAVRLVNNSRIIRVTNLNGVERADDNRFALVEAPNGEFLLSELGAGPLLFRQNGAGNPNAVPNIFDANDPTIYVSPQRFKANTEAAVGQNLAVIFQPNNIQGPSFFEYDLSSENFNGVVGERLTITGGKALTERKNGVSFFAPNQDSQTLSLLPFSDVGQFRLPVGAGFAGASLLPAAAFKQTPLIVDWDSGKLLYLGGVFQNLDLGGGSDRAAAIQVIVGNISGGNGAPVTFVGNNGGSTHFERNGQDFRSFSTGGQISVALGDVGEQSALSTDGGRLTIDPLGQVGVENHTFSQEQGANSFNLGVAGQGVVTENLFMGGIVANDLGELEILTTEPDISGVGTLTINRDAKQFVADAVVDNADLRDADPEFIITNAANSAFFSDDVFGVVQNNGFQNPGTIAIIMASGEAVIEGDVCACQFMHWGFWSGGEISPDNGLNSVADVGGFFAGVPTVSMPVQGTATYNGQAFASMALGNAAPFIATGDFQLNVNFANGVSAGSMNLAQENFAVIGNHSPGAPQLLVDYFQNAAQVGNGNGAFFGPNAENVGVTVRINGNGIQAGGVAIGEQ